MNNLFIQIKISLACFINPLTKFWKRIESFAAKLLVLKCVVLLNEIEDMKYNNINYIW